MKLSKMLATARKAKGISLRQLEERTGISNALISQMETGHVGEPSFRKVIKIGKALGISLNRMAGAE